MAFSRWPFDDRLSWPSDVLRTFAPLLQDPFFQTAGLPSRSAGVFPPVNVFENGEAYLVRAEIPGIDKDSLDVSVKGDELTLRGERRIAAAEPSANYHRRERSAGQFRRVLTLPKPVDAERIQATCKNGVLEVVLPFVPEAKPRKITVN